MVEVYINRKIQSWIDGLTELFCLQDNRPTIILKPKTNNTTGYCKYATKKENSVITIGCKNGLRLTTLVHEFIHAMGYKHTWEINGWANFRHVHGSYKTYQSRDTYSHLIVKDLSGKKELII